MPLGADASRVGRGVDGLRDVGAEGTAEGAGDVADGVAVGDDVADDRRAGPGVAEVLAEVDEFGPGDQTGRLDERVGFAVGLADRGAAPVVPDGEVDAPDAGQR